ncbi:porin family protein [Mucilaginibacter koreensis]
MKKFLFMAIVLLMAGITAADAQYYRPRPRYRRPIPSHREQRRSDDFYRPRIGLTGGVNIADIVSDDYDDFNTRSKVGFNAGIIFDVPVVYPFSIAPEVLYSQKGYRANTNYGSFAQRANFIDVPVLAKFKLAPAFNVLVGPQFSFLLSTRNTYYNGFTPTYEERYNYNGDKSFVDGVIGLSVDVNPNVELRARYTIDLQANDANGSTDGYPNYRNSVWQFGLGFKF